MTLIEQIEILRKELNEAIARNQGLANDEVLSISEQLDKIIYEYYRDQGIHSIVEPVYIQ